MGYMRVLGEPSWRRAEFSSYKLWVNVAEPMGINIYFFGTPGVTAFVWDAIVRRGDCVFDVGANVGQHALYAGALVGTQGRVFAFEANPFLAEKLRKSVAESGLDAVRTVSSAAVAGRSGDRLRFFLSTNSANTGVSSLVMHGVHLSAEKTIEVESVSLDDFAQEHAVSKVRLLKVDVERAEELVLTGANGLLATGRIEYVLIEMQPNSACDRMLRGFGYDGARIEHRTGRLVRNNGNRPMGDFLFWAPNTVPPLPIADD